MRNVLIGLAAVAILALTFILPGCGSVTTGHINAFTNLVDKLDIRGSGNIDDPAVEGYIRHETAVGVRLVGVQAQGSGQGNPESQPAPPPEPSEK